MKSIMISIKPKWCAKIMNGEKTIEVRKNKALANAIRKLIDEYGFADIYVYCTKDKDILYENVLTNNFYLNLHNPAVGVEKRNGKVLFKFRCYNVEEIDDCVDVLSTKSLDCLKLLQKSCLKYEELHAYLPSREDDNPRGCAIHISDLEIFDRPKELSEFKQPRDSYGKVNWNTNEYYFMDLTKAPQNFCYVEVE